MSTVDVVVPCYNYAHYLRGCVHSVLSQPNVDVRVLVIDDASSDATRQIAMEFDGITVLEAPALPEGWTGKANALWFAAQQARGKCLLFTDADTVHEAGDLHRALREAERHRAAMLSYSPRQLVRGLWQGTLMTLIFADLEQAYPPHLVNQPDSRVAAANGQFLMIQQDAYRSIGGHKTVRGSLLEDVELARRCKQSGEALRFRYAPDAVSTRMYRSFGAMCEGWRKNLAFLFPNALTRGLWKLVQFMLLFGLPLLAIWLYLSVARTAVIWAVGLWWAWRVRVHYANAVKAHFSVVDTLLSPLALPLFSWLLVSSWIHKNLRRSMMWKGRPTRPDRFQC